MGLGAELEEGFAREPRVRSSMVDGWVGVRREELFDGAGSDAIGTFEHETGTRGVDERAQAAVGDR